MTRRQLRARLDSWRSVPTQTPPPQAGWCCYTCRDYPIDGGYRAECALAKQDRWGDEQRECWRPGPEVQS